MYIRYSESVKVFKQWIIQIIIHSLWQLGLLVMPVLDITISPNWTQILIIVYRMCNYFSKATTWYIAQLIYFHKFRNISSNKRNDESKKLPALNVEIHLSASVRHTQRRTIAWWERRGSYDIFDSVRGTMHIPSTVKYRNLTVGVSLDTV